MPRKKVNLSQRELMVLDFIREYREKHGYAPAIRTIAAALNFNSTSLVKYYLDNLERENKISRQPGMARSIVILDPAQ